MKQHSVYDKFFKSLETDLRKEFQACSLRELRIANNYALLHEYNVTVEFRLSCNMKVSIICDTTFPDQPPKAFSQGSWSGQNIDPVTKEIDFAEIFPWSQSKRLVRLAARLESFFEEHCPTPNKGNETIVAEIESAKVLVNQNLVKIDRESLMGMVDQHEKAMLYDASVNRAILMRAREVEEIRQRIKKIIEKVAIKAGELSRNDSRKGRHD